MYSVMDEMSTSCLVPSEGWRVTGDCFEICCYELIHIVGLFVKVSSKPCNTSLEEANGRG